MPRTRRSRSTNDSEEQKRVDLYRRNPAVALATFGKAYFESLGLKIRRPLKRSPRASSNYFRAYYQRNREKLLAAAKAYHETNRDARLTYGRDYYQKNRRDIVEARRVENLSPEALDAKRAKERERYRMRRAVLKSTPGNDLGIEEVVGSEDVSGDLD